MRIEMLAGGGIVLEFPEPELMRFPESIIDKMGRLATDALKRRRNELLCERDGHDDEHEVESFAGVICRRCHIVLDKGKLEALKSG